MSRIRADKFVNSGANGAPQLTYGAEVVAGVGLTGAGGIDITGIATAASFSGATGSFTGNVSIGGVLTYEDVTSIDSVGIITAQSDVVISDKIIHLGDTNTAIRFPAADTFTVETAGSEKLRITSDGQTKILSTIWGGSIDGGVNVTTSYAARFYNNSAFPSVWAKNSGNGGLWEGVNSSGNQTSKINSDGTATFKGTVDATSGTYSYIGRRSSDNTAVFAVDDAGLVNVGPVSGSNSNIILNGSNGSATLVGPINLGTWANNANAAIYMVNQSNTGSIILKGNGSSDIAFGVYKNGWSSSNAVARINANGGATFDGLTTVKSDFFGSPIGNAAGITLTGANSTSATAFRVMPGSFPSTESINFSWTGNATFAGSVSKGSGSFKIDHPLPAKTETHHLVHSFIEGPQADLIYRGYVDLVDGQATVNIDTAGRMTEGTFEVLCTNVSCFTSNESDWTAVKGSVTGNVLTITAQDATSTSKVSWMVVGERKDQHMIDTDWTDSNGRVITEPLKAG